MRVFIIEDVDTGECHVFKNRKNAIDTMYRRCRDWGAILYTAKEQCGNYYQYKRLSKIGNTEEEQLNYLYQLSAAELCEVFVAYWYFQECEIEDEEG